MIQLIQNPPIWATETAQEQGRAIILSPYSFLPGLRSYCEVDVHEDLDLHECDDLLHRLGITDPYLADQLIEEFNDKRSYRFVRVDFERFYTGGKHPAHWDIIDCPWDEEACIVMTNYCHIPTDIPYPYIDFGGNLWHVVYLTDTWYSLTFKFTSHNKLYMKNVRKMIFKARGWGRYVN